MANTLAKVIKYDGSSSFTNTWILEILNDDLSHKENMRVELENKTASYHYSEGDILNLKGLQSWGWAVGMMKAKSTKSRKHN